MRVAWLTVIVVAFGAIGCGPPVVTIRHTLAPDLPVPIDGKVAVGAVRVVVGDEDSYGDFAAAKLAEHFKASLRHPLAEQAAQARLTVSATLRVNTGQTTGRRSIGRYNAERRQIEVLDVPTLVRTADVRADFVVRDARTGARLAAVEAHQSYDSTADPRTRGRLGTYRPDDPAHVPAAPVVVRELITACVRTFTDMLAAREVTVELPLRPTASQRGRQGLAAAGKGDFAGAVEHFAAATKGRPEDPDLLFNLAVCTERAGRLTEALAHYDRLAARKDDLGRLASAGAVRVKRVAPTK